ncbi:phosphopantetheine-binding protein [Streptomyces abyssomicinicus]|uniref:phosphopantetheine-binding protein n=1 Tax=Streptomyces abyssomicinicus TaxID=574929 RepID=UPI00124FFCC6|nr:phosphopantetheine-binding protein [Streptomyces abyssomicinicus]
MLSVPPRPDAPEGSLLALVNLTAEVVAVLADVLQLKPEQIDPRQTFRVLGLDSMLAVEFVADVNRRCGTAVRVGALADHPTPVALARHASSTLPSAPLASLASPPSAEPEDERPVADTRTAPDVLGVRHVLKEELAALLSCSPHDIDEQAPFRLLGVDSILGAEFLAAVNRVYGTAERGPVLQDHPTVAALAARLARTLAPRPWDVDSVLDFVRDGRLGIDEAVTLLSQHG